MFKTIYGIEHNIKITDINKLDALIHRLMSVKKGYNRNYILTYIAETYNEEGLDLLLSTVLDAFDISYINVSDGIIYVSRIDPTIKIVLNTYYKIKIEKEE